MDLRNSRVSNPPPSQSAEPSTSTSYSMLQNAQHVPMPNDFNTYGVPANNLAGSFAPVVGYPSQSISEGLFNPPGDYASGLQTTASQFGGTQFHSHNLMSNASMWNTASLFFHNSGSVSNQMAVLSNRVIGFPALAPAPPKPAPVAKALLEASTPPVMQIAPGVDTSTLTSLTESKPNGSQTFAKVQPQSVPLPTSALSISHTVASKQSTPTKSTPSKSSVKIRKRRTKRKRAHDSEDEIKAHDSSSDDESEDMLPSARQTKSGRQVNRPSFFAPSPEPVPTSRQKSSPSGTATTAPAKRRRKVYRKNGKEINVTCRHCQRGHSPVTNMIVFCDECNDAYHQYCHDPPIKQELIDDKDAQWFCNECRPETRRRVLLKLRLPPQQKNPPSIEIPNSSIPLVSGEQFTTEEQCGYLSSLSHAALVNMLVTLSKTNPTLPIFPENLKDLRRSKFAVAALTGSNPVKSTQMATVETKDAATPSVDEEDSDSDSDSGSEYEVEEHRLYPRSGNGFHLPPEEDDFDILLDDPACSTFSYTLHSYPQANTFVDSTQAVQVGG